MDHPAITIGFLCVGGEHEGIAIDDKAVTHTFEPDKIFRKPEMYIKIEPAKGQTPFFMLCGMRPVDAIARWRELTAGKQGA